MSNVDAFSIVTNCILWGNTSGSDGQQVFVSDSAYTSVITFSDIQGGCEAIDYADCGSGSTNINEDPEFVNAALGNLRLTDGVSPCINTGNSTDLPDDTTDLDGDSNTSEHIPFDLDLNPREVGASVDMGAYENPS